MAAKIPRAGLAGLLLFGVLAAVLVYDSAQLSEHSCEVCVSYKGRNKCRTVEASTVAEARQGAVMNACTFVSAGIRESMACQRSRPVSESCD